MQTSMKSDKLKKAFSLVELMISVSIMIIIGLALAISVAKKTTKAHTDLTGGEYTCYKDINGTLHQRIVEYFVNGTVPKITDRETGSCSFELPANATNGVIVLVGGGGGGGGFAHLGNLTEAMLNDYEVTFEPNIIRQINLNIQCSPMYMLSSSEPNAQITDCEVNDFVTGQTQMGRFVINDNKYACRTAVGTYSSPQNFLNPDEISFRNELADILSPAIYENEILSRYFFTLHGGGRADIAVQIPNLKLNQRYSCSSGVEQSNQTSTDGAASIRIAPSPGVIRLTNPDSVQIVKGSSWPGHADTSLYGATTTPGTAGLTSTLQYQGRQLKSIKLPYATNGREGETITINNANLAGRNIVINADSIGNGGQSGTNGTPDGANGGNTTINFDGVDYSARGGSGGRMVLSAEPVNLIRGVITSREARENRTEAMMSLYMDEAPISTFVNSVMTTGVVSPAELRATPTICSTQTRLCTPGRTPTAQALSYGAAGAGANSLLLYNRNINAQIQDTATRTELLNVGVMPELVTDTTQNRNGTGGAIVLRWGSVLR